MSRNLCNCPVCERALVITSYKCPKCHTKIEGEFHIDKFSRLSVEDKNFIEIFVRKRGSIKEIEKELGISYPTVRNKLDNVIAALGHKVEKDTSRIEILSLLDAGEISTEEATKMLNDLNEDDI
ncbi:MAG: DUF2089 domain-containing protein [Tissierellia bacterium]|nr:DUF2089 domain-containing protein [Tissierellia bacterium]